MIKIISDSTCDLAEDVCKRFDIDIIPLHILLGDEEHEDGIDIKKDDIFAWADANKTTPKTSAPSIERAISVMKPYLDDGNEVICFSISSSMSSSNNVMRLAGEELEAEDRVTVIDSANLSSGVGLLAIEASVMAKEGRSVKEIVERMEELKPLVRTSFVVDTLTYLHRGGRCSGLAALAGAALKLHPKISVVNGAMGPGKKYRGNIDKVIMAYVKDLEEELKNAMGERAFIVHSGCSDETVNAVKEYLESLNVFDEIIIGLTGGVISSHCGPGTLGVIFISK